MNLIDLLATPAYTGLSAEEQLALASVPIKTPRPNPITWTTLNGGGGGATGTYGKHYGG